MQLPALPCTGLAVGMLLSISLQAAAAESLDMIGKWSVDSITRPDPTTPNLTSVVHPQAGTMTMTIDHATIATAVSSAGAKAQVDKERYTILEESPTRVLIRVLSAKPYNITISQEGDHLRWTTSEFVIRLIPYDAQRIAQALAAEAHEAARSIASPLPALADQVLRGQVDGRAWTAATCVASPVQLTAGVIRCSIRAAVEAGSPDLAAMPQLLLEVPTTPGRYALGATRSVTFCVPPSRNLVASEGELVVSAVASGQLEIALLVRFDADNQVNGHITLTLPGHPDK